MLLLYPEFCVASAPRPPAPTVAHSLSRICGCGREGLDAGDGRRERLWLILPRVGRVANCTRRRAPARNDFKIISHCCLAQDEDEGSARETDKWEFNRAQLKQHKQLGSGAFGVGVCRSTCTHRMTHPPVYEGLATRIRPDEQTTRVAVKARGAARKPALTGADAERRQPLGGDLVFQRSRHHEVRPWRCCRPAHDGRALDGPFNIVRLLGVCTQEKPYLMIMELMGKGDLKSLLRDTRPKVWHVPAPRQTNACRPAIRRRSVCRTWRRWGATLLTAWLTSPR